MRVKFTTFSEEFRLFKKDFIKSFKEVGSRGDYILGKDLKKFEKNISRFLKVKHVLGVGNWTEGTIMLMKALNFKSNDEIAQNISLKDKNIDKEKLRKIFQICGINNLVNNFEEIFDKKLEINSPNVSGGQKQRIAIARVLYLEPEILILDEATNALDRKNEKEIIEKIQQYKKKLTLLVVTHRNINIKFNKVLLIKKINNKKFKLFNK